MWKNMTWLAEEWRYWYEWKKMALARRLDGEEQPPPKNNPFRYTFQWVGVAVALPATVIGVVGVLGWAISTSEQVMKVAVVVSISLASVVWVIWILHSLIAMSDNGPSDSVVSRWRQTHNAKSH